MIIFLHSHEEHIRKMYIYKNNIQNELKYKGNSYTFERKKIKQITNDYLKLHIDIIHISSIKQDKILQNKR